MSRVSRPASVALALLLALVAGTLLALPAQAHVEAPNPGPGAINPAAQWTPPPEPSLTPVPVTHCPSQPTKGTAACLSEVGGQVADGTAAETGRADAIGSTDSEAPLPDQAVPQAVTKTGGYSPADLASLYRIPAGLTSAATIGIIDVGSDPNTAKQLNYYRSYFGLPACTSANGCFREVAQDGSGRLPGVASGWVTEIAMDVQAVSAICPTCHILLVDAATASAGDLGAAAATAVRLGAKYVSMSYGSVDGSQNTTLNLKYYNSPGVTYVAASGDSGYAGGTIFPSSATNVIAAGGTSAKLVDGHWQQTTWSGAGSGCSSAGLLGTVTGLVQSLLSGSSCPDGRAVSDVSALADANTGILFYQGGDWYNGGGTSLAAPIITALYALAGNHTEPLAIYHNVSSRPTSFVDITTGTNGSCGSRPRLCTAAAGWDGPTGVGTPAGLSGLLASGAPALPLARPNTAAALTRSGSYPATLHYRLVDATTGAPVSGATVRVEANAGRGLALLGTARTAGDGTLSYPVRPHGPTSYQVLYAGDAAHASSTSASVALRVFTPHVRLRRVARGVRVIATAPWGGPAAQLPVRLQARGGGGWHTVKHLRTSAHGKVTAVVHHKARGKTYRARYGGGAWSSGRTHALRLHR